MKDDDTIEIEVEEAAPAPFMQVMTPGQMGDNDMQDMLGSLMPKKRKKRTLTIKEAKEYFTGEEARAMIDQDQLTREAVTRAEQSGIIFVDEMDKIAGRHGSGGGSGPDVSREGVQRDILPIIEGSIVQTKQGPVKTDFILFIAAGAFHLSKPSDLIPELQGRLPIRVELESLTQEDFQRILTEPRNALVKQYQALLATEGLTVEFTQDAIAELARLAAEVNAQMENIGARRLHTIMERLLDELSFDASEREEKTVTIDAAYVKDKLAGIVKNEDLRPIYPVEDAGEWKNLSSYKASPWKPSWSAPPCCSTANSAKSAYEVVQEADPARGVLYKLRVTEVAHSIAELTARDDDGLDFGESMPWLAGTLAPLAPDAFCKALDGAFAQALEEQPTVAQDPPAPVSPLPLLELPSVNLSTGNIRHAGDIRVHGNVAKAMRIQADGAIHVLGEVENSFLQAGGDIVVTGGFLGSALSTHGRISCKFLHGAQLEATRESIVVQDSAMHSHLVAGKSVVVRGAVVGGSCYGYDFVEARVAGSESSVPTVLLAGHNKRLMDRVETIRARAERNVRLLGECQRLRDTLLPVEQRGDELPIEDRVRLWTAAIRKGRIHADLMRLSAEKSAALGMINRKHSVRVSVTDKIFPKVKVLVDDAPLEVRAVTQFVSFYKGL